MSDSIQTIQVNLRTDSGEKTTTVRFPTDEQWKKRRRAQTPIQRNLGRGVSETILPSTEESDLEIYRAIKTEDSPDLDPFEASSIIQRMALCRLISLERVGSNYEVAFKTIHGAMRFAMKSPTVRQQVEYQRTIVRLLDLPGGAQKTVVNLDVAAKVFDELLVDGDRSVSIIYKAEAASQVMGEVIRNLDEGGEDF